MHESFSRFTCGLNALPENSLKQVNCQTYSFALRFGVRQMCTVDCRKSMTRCIDHIG